MSNHHNKRDAEDSRYLESMRRRASKRLGDPTTLQLARQCSLQLSQRLQQEARLSNADYSTGNLQFIDNSGDHDNHTTDDDSVASSTQTDYSNQRAVLRGARMGSFETRERRNTRDSYDDDLQSDFAGSTIMTADATTAEYTLPRNRQLEGVNERGATLFLAPSPTNKTKLDKGKRKWGRRRKSRSVASSSSTVAAAGAPLEAWMCGVCGKAFATFEACERHEDWHIHAVCAEFLGEMGTRGSKSEQGDVKDGLFMDDSVASETRSRFKSSRQRLFTEDESLSMPLAAVQSDRRQPSPLNWTGLRRRKESQEKINDADAVKEPWELVGGSLIEAAPSKQIAQHQEVRFNEYTVDEDGDSNTLLGSSAMNDYLMLADEALVNVCQRAQPLLLTKAELTAERHLALLSRDKAYYDDLALRAIVRRKNPYNKFRSEGDAVRDKVRNKLVDAYQIMKQGDNTRGMTDQYTKVSTGTDKDMHAMAHSTSTLYVNVMVKNSVDVVKRELERLAKERWERPDGESDAAISKFQRFRVYAHVNFVKLAGLALASDFTPRRIAIQLSNDLYRLMTPRLKRRGVTIETEIEYRVGGYFVLAVNINGIDWLRLMKANVVDVASRMRRWEREEAQRNEQKKTKQWFWYSWLRYIRQFLSLTWFDVLSRALSLLYYFHWSISVPICWLAYHSPLAITIRMYILSSVTDEIFYYIEKKGMEMEIRVLQANSQASFMLQALRQIRAGDRELKKKRQETEAQDVGIILGNLLGPSVKADKEPVPPAPEGFVMPENLEFVVFEVELPVGFRRLRWAVLSDQSKFMPEAVMKTEGKLENITIGPWEKYSELIGNPILPDDVKLDDFIGVTKEQEYLMPKSAFVSANMAYDIVTIIAYNDTCFAFKKKTRTPDVPFGSTFFSWSMLRFENLGGNQVRMTCSVEAEFPNGPPMIARQIQSGLRAGTAETFVSLGETITKYSEAFP